MSAIQMITKSTNYIQFSDLENFVKKHYGHTIEIAAMEMCGNDTSLTFYVSDGPVDEDEFQEHAAWLMDGRFWPYGTRNILNQLCTDGYIPAGDYVIEVSW